jgi:hypothetical protein
VAHQRQRRVAAAPARDDVAVGVALDIGVGVFAQPVLDCVARVALVLVARNLDESARELLDFGHGSLSAVSQEKRIGQSVWRRW